MTIKRRKVTPPFTKDEMREAFSPLVIARTRRNINKLNKFNKHNVDTKIN